MRLENKFSPLEVRARPDESGEKLIKRFMRKVRDDGVLREVYERQSYEKPSDRRRHKRIRSKHISRQVALEQRLT